MDARARTRYSSRPTPPVLVDRPMDAAEHGTAPLLCLRCTAHQGPRSRPLVRFEWGRVVDPRSRR